MDASQEIRRLRYLQAMGVPVYVTRRVLPGAAVTSKITLKESVRMAGAAEPQEQAAPIAPITAPQKTSSPAAQALREFLRQDIDRQKPAPGAATDTASARETKGAARQDSAPRFRLAALITKGRLWLEELGDEALAQDQLQLVAAMARALEHPVKDEAAVAVTEFRWPLHDNAQLGLSADDATAALQGFLSRQLDENACVELICLGNASRKLIADLAIPCARRAISSTRDMLENPSIKGDVWKALRA
ncbi:hypothetical protein [Congregibacter litoralis]|uniref:Uncharacterized protein n=1 Tax=Congregibacter litoralis KT71 TaxID=314285 RepID=A4ACN0_9GAMM|nr:hypothetical protein [Congregibacter litoralis]EAQ96244.1 hypothetical protein KT71_19303 [Congregibacter litoralis KT71]